MTTMAKLVLIGAAAALAATPAVWSGLPPARQVAMAASTHPAPAPAGSSATGSAHLFNLAPFGPVALYFPKGTPRSVVLFLSGDGGWNKGVVDMARAMTSRGALVAGVSTPAFLKALEAKDAKCINPNFALTALAQAVENRGGMSDYQRPLLAGYSSGATLAFAALAQAPKGIYDGAISLGFGPDLPGVKPWCAAPGFTATRIAKPEAGWIFGARTLPAPWLMLQGQQDQVVSPDAARRFVGAIPQGELIELPKVGHGFGVEANWMPQFNAAFDRLLAARSAPVAGGTGGLPLDIVTDPAAPASDVMAVLYSGDGGWAGIDRQIAASLAARGIPVVGVDSLRYYWNAKSPAQAGRDLGAIVTRYGRQWNRPRAIIIGYSFGADALPFAVGAMPADARAHIAKLALMGLDTRGDLQFHLTSWIGYSGGASRPTVPAIAALRGMNIQCIRGADEAGSACDALSPGIAARVVLPGGHHFDGAYQRLATVLAGGVA